MTDSVFHTLYPETNDTSTFLGLGNKEATLFRRSNFGDMEVIDTKPFSRSLSLDEALEQADTWLSPSMANIPAVVRIGEFSQEEEFRFFML